MRIAVAILMTVAVTGCSRSPYDVADLAVRQSRPALANAVTREMTSCASPTDREHRDGSGYITGWVDPPSGKTVRFFVEMKGRGKPGDVLFDVPGRRNVLSIMRQIRAAHEAANGSEIDCWNVYQDALEKVIEINTRETGNPLK